MPIFWNRCGYCDRSFEANYATDECPACAEKYTAQMVALAKALALRPDRSRAADRIVGSGKRGE
jgi:hypothetical protein